MRITIALILYCICSIGMADTVVATQRGVKRPTGISKEREAAIRKEFKENSWGAEEKPTWGPKPEFKGNALSQRIQKEAAERAMRQRGFEDSRLINKYPAMTDIMYKCTTQIWRQHYKRSQTPGDVFHYFMLTIKSSKGAKRFIQYLKDNPRGKLALEIVELYDILKHDRSTLEEYVSVSDARRIEIAFENTKKDE